jgi:hypothetical protein
VILLIQNAATGTADLLVLVLFAEEVEENVTLMRLALEETISVQEIYLKEEELDVVAVAEMNQNQNQIERTNRFPSLVQARVDSASVEVTILSASEETTDVSSENVAASVAQ